MSGRLDLPDPIRDEDIHPCTCGCRGITTKPKAVCPKCGSPVRVYDEHYVSSVGHLTDPADAIQPYWTCQR